MKEWIQNRRGVHIQASAATIWDGNTTHLLDPQNFPPEQSGSPSGVTDSHFIVDSHLHRLYCIYCIVYYICTYCIVYIGLYDEKMMKEMKEGLQWDK